MVLDKTLKFKIGMQSEFSISVRRTYPRVEDCGYEKVSQRPPIAAPVNHPILTNLSHIDQPWASIYGPFSEVEVKVYGVEGVLGCYPSWLLK